MWEQWGVEILAFPLTWHIAYTTACGYRTSRDVDVTNAFGVLGSLPEDVEACWETIRATILGTAQDTLPVVTKPNRPWLSTDTLSIIQKKRETRLRGSTNEWRRYKGICRARAKADLENHYCRLADEAEERVKQNNLRCVFRTIRQLGKKPTRSSTNVPVHRCDGRPCTSTDEELECWRLHYDNTLNHAPASISSELDFAALNATPNTDILDDAPSLGEVHRAIQKLKNGRAAGPDGIQPELLVLLFTRYSLKSGRQAKCPLNGAKAL